jgi:hypothetical protein
MSHERPDAAPGRIFAVVVWAALPACVFTEGGDAIERSAELQVADATERRMAGELAVDGTTIAEFAAVAGERDSDASTSVVRVGDALVEWGAVPSTGEFWFDGHDLVITSEQREAMQHLARSLESQLVPDGQSVEHLGFHERLLLAHTSWLADAEVGTTISRHEEPIAPASASPDGSALYGYYDDYPPLCLNDWRGLPRTAYIRDDNGTFPTKRLTVGGTGGNPHHPGDWSCLGQCGAGCQSSWKNGHFLDCFEHDACTYTRPSDRCDWAFAYAADDYLDSVGSLYCN